MDEPESTRIFVGGLSAATTAEDIQLRFGKLPGVVVTSAEVVRSSSTGESKGFGYVSIAAAADSAPVNQLMATFQGTLWKGNRLMLQLAKEHYLKRMARERTQPGYFPETPVSPRPYTRMKIRVEDSDGNTVSSCSDSCSEDGEGVDADRVDGDVGTSSDATDGSRASDAVSSEENAHVSLDVQTFDEASLQSAEPESGAHAPARVAVVNVKSWQGMLNEAKASSGGFTFSFLSPAETSSTAPLNAANAAVVSMLTGKQQPAVRPALVNAARIDPVQEVAPEPKKSRNAISYSALRADTVAPPVRPLGSAAQRMLASVKLAASAPADKQRRLRIDFKRKAKEALKLSFRKRTK